ncbi:methyltransferase domain-containing protein [Nocardia sp. GCM10030253]|uniref:methyltransferase domain-containing protein n=1 Tax=Nocardia sp. GCM10030253 TaxID=3273404 RepID=UPI003633A2C6
MTRNEQQSAITRFDDDNEVGVLLTKPRGYRAFKTAFLLGRSSALNARLIALIGALPGEHALDIGSGPGDLARALAVRVGPSGRVIGVDPSPQMVAYATERTRGQSNCRFELGPAQSLQLADASVDVVTCTFVMHHIPEAQRATAIAHMFRVLRPGGRLLLADTHPTGRVLPAVIKGMARYAGRRTHDGAAVGRRADPLAAIDIRRYRETLVEAGFRTVDFTEVKPATGAILAIKDS